MVSWSIWLRVVLQLATSGMPISNSVTNDVAHQPPVDLTPDVSMTNHNNSDRLLNPGQHNVCTHAVCYTISTWWWAASCWSMYVVTFK